MSRRRLTTFWEETPEPPSYLQKTSPTPPCLRANKTPALNLPLTFPSSEDGRGNSNVDPTPRRWDPSRTLRSSPACLPAKVSPKISSLVHGTRVSPATRDRFVLVGTTRNPGGWKPEDGLTRTGDQTKRVVPKNRRRGTGPRLSGSSPSRRQGGS